MAFSWLVKGGWFTNHLHPLGGLWQLKGGLWQLAIYLLYDDLASGQVQVVTASSAITACDPWHILLLLKWTSSGNEYILFFFRDFLKKHSLHSLKQFLESPDFIQFHLKDRFIRWPMSSPMLVLWPWLRIDILHTRQVCKYSLLPFCKSFPVFFLL